MSSDQLQTENWEWDLRATAEAVNITNINVNFLHTKRSWRKKGVVIDDKTLILVDICSALKTDTSTKETEQKSNMEGQIVIFHSCHYVYSSLIPLLIFHHLLFSLLSNRRLHRLLLIERSCHQRWNNVPWKRKCFNAQLVCDRPLIFLTLLNTNIWSNHIAVNTITSSPAPADFIYSTHLLN